MSSLLKKFKGIQDIYTKALDYSLVASEYVCGGDTTIEEERKSRKELEDTIHKVILNKKEYSRYVKEAE